MSRGFSLTLYFQIYPFSYYFGVISTQKLSVFGTEKTISKISIEIFNFFAMNHTSKHNTGTK